MGDRRVITYGVQKNFWHDIYHYAMTSSWPVFLATFASFFLSLNLIFAILFSLEKNAIANLNPSGFLGAFFFSVETLATVGYGDMHPQSLYGHTVATIEIFVGMCGLAMMTGVMFARFSRPKAKILFTRHPVIYHLDGEQVLSLRIANTRMNIIAEASAKLRLLRLENTPDNPTFTRIIDLPLKRDQHPMFSLGWNLFHIIDKNSPLYKISISDLERASARLILSIEGVDEATGQTIHARQMYNWDTFKFNRRHKDITRFDDNMVSHMDYNLFDEVETVTGPEALEDTPKTI